MNLRIAARAAAALALAGTLAAPALASPAVDAVSTCMTDNTTGKDRKDLTRWIFIAMATHPSLEDLSQVSMAAADESQRRVADLVTQLITVRCVDQVRALMKAEGSDSLGKAFEALGRVAFMELTTNPAVAQTLQGYTRYLDRKRFEQAFAPR